MNLTIARVYGLCLGTMAGEFSPAFIKCFILGDPVHVLDHVMVVGVPDHYEPTQLISDCVTGGHLLRPGQL